ncbi:hypothetical protein L8S15_13260 [Vibrio sp. S/42/10]|uniref:hypothetical protein n=1 Tax=Vibrio sp. S/42/10 TaxID=2914757 RepID=UPI0024693F7A|nr:hypothetical protein [Vibrio sp. S/42/10]MDH5880064.1 hypothetical protein [Vibrio sp. S/42/10]
MFKNIIVFIIVIGVGYWTSYIFNFDKKMEFSDTPLDAQLHECRLEGDYCLSEEYELQLIDGSFAALQRTVFTLNYRGSPVTGKILVTSDDNQFGTLIGQAMVNQVDRKQVLIPFCGNPVMNIMVIDALTNSGIIITSRGIHTENFSKRGLVSIE